MDVPEHDVAVPLLSLPADLGIEHAAALKAQLLTQLEQPRLGIDGAAATRIHAASLQLLLMFCRERRRAGLHTLWRASSAPLGEAAAVLGMTEELQLTGGVA